MKFFHLCLITLLSLNLSACLENKEKSEEVLSPISIENAYGFATMPGAATGAAFMIIKNDGTEDDKLISVASHVATITEIHENLIDPDTSTMMMRKIKHLDIPAKGEVVLKPKGYHVMFIKLNEPLTMDTSVPITLTFEKAGERTINIKIMSPGKTPKHNHAH